MTISGVSAGMAARWQSPSQIGQKNDPDGGADRAKERGGSTTAVFAQISAQAMRLAAGISNDADHGADGK